MVIFPGDNIYADTTDMKVMISKYKRLKKSRPFQNLLNSYPVIATWDNHDNDANDAGANYPKKRERVIRSLLGSLDGKRGQTSQRRNSGSSNLSERQKQAG